MKKSNQPHPRPSRQPETPRLRFSPTAWAKLLYLRDAVETEVGGFGISDSDDLLYVQDVCLVTQTTTAVSVCFDDEAVADFFDAQVDAGRRPEQFARLWIHSHPGQSAEPSDTDLATFARVFGSSDWAVMMIIARGGATTGRLRFNVGPGGQLALPVAVDYSRPFAGSKEDAWQAEVEACVHPQSKPDWSWPEDEEVPDDLCLDTVTLEDLADMDEDERSFVLAELGVDHWGVELW
jgi:proteasome lid subunit RPN8/RPN11